MHRIFLILSLAALGWISPAVATTATAAQLTATGVHTFADHSLLAEGTWVKVALGDDTDGVYQITYSQLRSWGFAHPEQVGVYGYGGHELGEAFSTGHADDLPEVAVYHDATRQRLLFYGQGLVRWDYRNSTYRYVQRQNTYATQSTYFLHEKSTAPIAMDTLSAGHPNTSASGATLYDERLLHEVETTNIGQTGREWYGESLLYTTALTKSFSIDGIADSTALLTVRGVANAGGTTTLRVLATTTSDQATHTVGTGSIAAPTNSYYKACETTVNVSTPAYGSTLAVAVQHQRGNYTVTRAYLDYIRLQFRRKIALYENDFTLFRRTPSSASQSYVIDGYDATTMQVWDVTSPTAVALQKVTDGAFAASTAGREYALVHTSGTFTGVTYVGHVDNQDLHGLTTPQLVIIAAPLFLEQAQRLANYRRSHDSLSVAVVTPTQVYNEFSSGRPDATAYRLLMKMFYDRSQADPNNGLRYLLLFGDGSYNNRRAGTSYNQLLTYQSDASLIETSSQVCDDYFGFLDDTEGGRRDNNYRYTINQDALDIGIGRLPVSTVTEAQAVIDKIINYSNNTYYGAWKNRLCFLADDDKIEGTTSDSPNLHMTHADEMVSLLQRKGYDEFTFQKIYLAAYKQTTAASGTEYPEASKEFLDALKQGVLLVNYSGHGSTTNITHEGLMTSAIASSLSMRYLPLWITATCDFSRYDDDDTSCGERLLLNANGGAIALISTTRVVYASENLLINRGVINRVFDKTESGQRARLGDVIREAKVDLGSNTNKLNFCLLGDPTLSLVVPQDVVHIDSINGQPADGDAITLPALSRVTISGHVSRAETTDVDTTFNGLVYPTLYDAAETETADKGLHQEPVFSFETRKRKIFTGREVVRSGRFDCTFIVPQDLLYSDGTGLINLYACDADGSEAAGSFSRFYLQGLNTQHDVDTLGPEIRLLTLDNFTSEQLATNPVGTTPYFSAEVYDASGFNTTGNGIGHDVSLTVRSETAPLTVATQHILNDYFTGNTGDPTTGHVRFSLSSLDAGTYSATFRISDVYNNTSSRTFTFRVSDTAQPVTSLVQAYPSPAEPGETVTFRVLHNRPESDTKVRVQVFTQSGVKVWEGTSTGGSAEVVYTADGAPAYALATELNADEGNTFYGASTLQWTPSTTGHTLAPGLYIYRAYISSAGSSEATKSKLLLVQSTAGNKND
jgi:hypothetical protein